MNDVDQILGQMSRHEMRSVLASVVKAIRRHRVGRKIEDPQSCVQDILLALWEWDLDPTQTSEATPPRRLLSRVDLVDAASRKGGRVVGDMASGELTIEAPEGHKWDGDTSFYVVRWNPKDRQDQQDALRDAIERVEGATALSETNDDR